MLNVSHRRSQLDYEALHKITAMLTRNSQDVLRMFRNMTFNVFAHNRDDHCKNHAFLMDANGRWTLSPAYDLTYSDGPAGEHNAAIAGEGRNPDRDHLFTVAKSAPIVEREALEVIDEVRAAVDRWPQYADEAGHAKARASALDQKLNGSRRPQEKSRLGWQAAVSRPAMRPPQEECGWTITDTIPMAVPEIRRLVELASLPRVEKRRRCQVENRTSTPVAKRSSRSGERQGKQKGSSQIMPPQRVDLLLAKSTAEEVEAPPAELVRGRIRRRED